MSSVAARSSANLFRMGGFAEFRDFPSCPHAGCLVLTFTTVFPVFAPCNKADVEKKDVLTAEAVASFC